MSITGTLAVEFLKLASETLIEIGTTVTPEKQADLIEGWIRIYEDVPPRTTAERAVHDALHQALERTGRMELHNALHH